MMNLPKTIKKILKPFYMITKNTGLTLLDLFDRLSGKKDPLVPPRTMIFIGDGDYKKIGNEFFNYFVELGHLKPNNKVLDVGCGIGRMAVPLVKYLSKDGEYYGFDIVKKGIDWCNENISTQYPNFHFDHSNIFNKSYNPKGAISSSEYNFNYSNDFFDFVYLTSVFTHMLKEDMEHYLKEINRVLKPGGRCLITCFLINKESLMLIKEGKASQNLRLQIDEVSYVKDSEIPESAIGFDEEWVLQLLNTTSFETISKHYGSWCGREKYKSYQDIMIIQKNKKTNI